MKNCAVTLTFFPGYRLKLQISKYAEDNNGFVKAATAWTQFCDPNQSAAEYGKGDWTIDEWGSNMSAVKLVWMMIDVQNRYNGGSLGQEDAINEFKQYYKEWVEAHKKTNRGFVEKQVVGLNRVTSLGDTCKNVVQFFKDVPNFQVGARFLNTLCLRTKMGGRDAAVQYVNGYFSLQGKRDEADVICAKMSNKHNLSPEWDAIEAGLMDQEPSVQINKRLKLYFGAAGTGKTTFALGELNDLSNVIVCNAAMDSNDMLFDFDFDENGKPRFKPGKLYNACEAGETILLDEINLLNDEVLRFLQGITDNKPTFTAKGHEIHVKDGFMIIGTMNLTVNGQIFPLPDPLVDRALEIREFEMDASLLENALL